MRSSRFLSALTQPSTETPRTTTHRCCLFVGCGLSPFATCRCVKRKTNDSLATKNCCVSYQSVLKEMKRAHLPSSGGKQGAPKKTMVTRSSVVTLDKILSVPTLFEQIVAKLHWKDALVLGAVNLKYHKACRGQYDMILQPVLEKLESLCGSNVHFYCQQVYAPESVRVCTCATTVQESYDHPQNQALGAMDHRYKKSYDALPIQSKCAKMALFLTKLVSNMRPHLNFDDAANPRNMPYAIGNIGGWSLGYGVPGNGVLKLFPNRAALAFNIALAVFAQSAMKEGDDHYFNDAFLGEGGIISGGSGFGTTICDIVGSMLPLSNEKFVRYIRHASPSPRTCAFFGPGLTSRVVLCAPFSDWINENGEMVLPKNLEPFDAAAAQRSMDEWDPTEDGRERSY